MTICYSPNVKLHFWLKQTNKASVIMVIVIVTVTAKTLILLSESTGITFVFIKKDDALLGQSPLGIKLICAKLNSFSPQEQSCLSQRLMPLLSILSRIISEKTMQGFSALRSVPLSARPSGSGLFYFFSFSALLIK